MNAVELTKIEALVGRVIADRYRVDGILGVGGMGAVLRCHHLGLQRDVAVKVLHPEMSLQPEVSARFDREAQSASRLDHPNCVQVFDYGTWNAEAGEPPLKFMAMQLLSGCELTQLLGEPLEPKRAIALIDQVLAALEHAHGHGVIHRDLKPQNVFVTEDHAGRELLKLVDFGIAKVVSGEGADAKMTRVGIIFGTPRYMSPEQAAGGEVDERTDLYAAGIILYEMLAGHVPFAAEDVTVVIRQQLSVDPPPLPASVPPRLSRVVSRLLAKDRGDRFESAAAVRQALRGKHRTPTPVPPEAVPKSTPRPTPSKSGPSLVFAPTLLPHSSESTDANLAAAPTVFPLVAPPEQPRRARLLLAGGSLLLAGVLGWKLWPAEASSAPSASPSATNETALVETLRDMGIAPGRASSDELQAIDRGLGDKDYVAAKEVAAPLLEKYPDDAQLLWRYGKILGKTNGERAEVLAHYRRAVEADAKLLDDAAFWSELSALMREEPLRTAAMELAVTKLGDRGHPFLLELVNRDVNLVSYDERHLILDALEDGELASQIDWRLQRALDLWQAEQTASPCSAFAKALVQIHEDPDPYYLGTLDRIRPPKAPANDRSNARCKDLGKALDKVKKLYAQRYRTYTGERPVPAAFKSKKKRRRTLRSLFGL